MGAGGVQNRIVSEIHIWDSDKNWNLTLRTKFRNMTVFFCVFLRKSIYMYHQVPKWNEIKGFRNLIYFNYMLGCEEKYLRLKDFVYF